MKKKGILYLIFLCITNYSFTQNIDLTIQTNDSIDIKKTIGINYKKNHQNIKSVKSEISIITNKLEENGYLNYNLKKLKKKNDSTFIQTIELNKKYNNILIYYNKNDLSKKTLKKITSKETVITDSSFTTSIKKLKYNLNNITEYLTENGAVFSNSILKEIQIKNNLIAAKLNITKSKEKKITNIKIKGYSKFPKKFIKNYLNLKKNQPINIKEIERKSEKINRLTFAKELKKPEILFKKDSTVVYLYIKKQKSNDFDGFLGFSTNEEKEKIELNGNINILFNNNLNYGEKLTINYLSTENEQKTTKINLSIPFILKTPINIDGGIEIFKKDTSFTNTNQKINLSYIINDEIKIGTSYNYLKSNVVTEENTNIQDFLKNDYSLTLEYILYNKFKTDFSFGFGKRKTVNETTNQQLVKLNSELTINLNKRNSIYLKTTNNYLFSKNILDNEYIYIGGIKTIRGVRENSIPTYQYTILTKEYRIKLSETLQTYTAIDYALFRNNDTPKTNKTLGFGIGIKLKRKENIFNIVFANSKSNSTKIDLKDTKIHISLSTRF